MPFDADKGDPAHHTVILGTTEIGIIAEFEGEYALTLLVQLHRIIHKALGQSVFTVHNIPSTVYQEINLVFIDLLLVQYNVAEEIRVNLQHQQARNLSRLIFQTVGNQDCGTVCTLILLKQPSGHLGPERLPRVPGSWDIEFFHQFRIRSPFSQGAVNAFAAQQHTEAGNLLKGLCHLGAHFGQFFDFSAVRRKVRQFHTACDNLNRIIQLPRTERNGHVNAVEGIVDIILAGILCGKTGPVIGKHTDDDTDDQKRNQADHNQLLPKHHIIKKAHKLLSFLSGCNAANLLYHITPSGKS